MDSLRKKRDFLILVVFTFIISALAGCSVSIGGGSPQKKPEISPSEIRSNVKKEMQSPETKKLIEDAAKTQKLEELLATPEADRLIQKKIIDNFDTAQVSVKLQEDMKKILAAPDVQKQFQEQVKKAIESPEVQKAVSSAVQKALMQLLQGGGQGGGGQGGGMQGQGGMQGAGGGGGGAG